MNQCSVINFSKAFLTLKRRLWGKQVWAVLAKGRRAPTKLERNFPWQAWLGFMLIHHNSTKLSLSGWAHLFQAKWFCLHPAMAPRLREAEGTRMWWLLLGQGQPLASALLRCRLWDWCHHPMDLSSQRGEQVPPSPPEGLGHCRDAPGALLWHFLY